MVEKQGSGGLKIRLERRNGVSSEHHNLIPNPNQQQECTKGHKNQGKYVPALLQMSTEKRHHLIKNKKGIKNIRNKLKRYKNEFKNSHVNKDDYHTIILFSNARTNGWHINKSKISISRMILRRWILQLHLKIVGP